MAEYNGNEVLPAPGIGLINGINGNNLWEGETDTESVSDLESVSDIAHTDSESNSDDDSDPEDMTGGGLDSEIDMLEYKYLSPELFTQAPCPSNSPDITVHFYMYAIGRAFIEGPSESDVAEKQTAIRRLAENKSDGKFRGFLPRYDTHYPYLKIKAIRENTTIRFPKLIRYECVAESKTGDTRFSNTCIQELGKLFPEWGEYMETHPECIPSIFCGSVPMDESNVCAVLNVTELQHIPTNDMNWFLLDELLYSPDIWTPDSVVRAIFRKHPDMRHIMIQGQDGKMEICPTPLCVYSASEIPSSILPSLHPTWGWVYMYSSKPEKSTPVENRARFVGFMVHVLYATDPSRDYSPEWEYSGIVYQQQQGRPLWMTRQPFQMLA